MKGNILFVMKKLMVLDGNSIINRAFYGIRLLTNSEGLYTNAIYGFVNILLKYTQEEKPDYICVAFDVAPLPSGMKSTINIKLKGKNAGRIGRANARLKRFCRL